MMGGSERVWVDGIPTDVFNKYNGVMVGTGWYGRRHGLCVKLEPEYYREVVGMRAEADTLLELALDRMSEQTGIERTEESTVRVDRTALATLADNGARSVKKIQEDGKWRKDVSDPVHEAREVLEK
ncbi:hypothetical protein Hlac_3504 (plasmid) [Halorubrum lacusprofundi ATCC 49239]|jgi:hypothetical protein|uniref:Uncharacterized protein n=1 Tax=Halorubrum lacusprofundi (strain ATCC 49239 / DSM 5036 / JCM 8891 / ACAM 34) TaxID=416348 RepID=B9LX22_HALLT|nr:hypothetical protein [Halorubrum lacusprofundi]ACM59013.1 hypothetical protein Hlac_3504 [Halorubrum lacusprofundi ATCC 49239]